MWRTPLTALSASFLTWFFLEQQDQIWPHVANHTELEPPSSDPPAPAEAAEVGDLKEQLRQVRRELDEKSQKIEELRAEVAAKIAPPRGGEPEAAEPSAVGDLKAQLQRAWRELGEQSRRVQELQAEAADAQACLSARRSISLLQDVVADAFDAAGLTAAAQGTLAWAEARLADARAGMTALVAKARTSLREEDRQSLAVAAQVVREAALAPVQALRPELETLLKGFLQRHPEHTASLGGRDPVLIALVLVALLHLTVWELHVCLRAALGLLRAILIAVLHVACCPCRCCCARRAAIGQADDASDREDVAAGESASAATQADDELKALVRARYADGFLHAMLGRLGEALSASAGEAQARERRHFFGRKETPERAEGWLCKLVLHAPEEWYEILSEQPLPEGVKNNFKEIGVSFDASSRLRRAGIDFFHWRLTDRLRKSSGYCADAAYYIDRHSNSEGRVEKCAKLSDTQAPGTYRVVAISDTHHFHEHLGELPKGDILIHAGDLCYEESRSTSAETFEQYKAQGGKLSGRSFLSWFKKSGLPLHDALKWLGARPDFEHRVLVGGNHDYVLEQLGPENAQELCKSFGVTYLHTDRTVEELRFTKGPAAGASVRIWGSGLSFMAGVSADRAVKSGNNAFQITQEEGEEFLQQRKRALPEGGLDIMVVHSPPQNGELLSKKATGTDYITEMIKHAQPKLYVCGHSHRPADPLKGISAELGDSTEGGKGTTLGVNAACLGVWNQLHGYPVVVDM